MAIFKVLVILFIAFVAAFALLVCLSATMQSSRISQEEEERMIAQCRKARAEAEAGHSTK